MPRKRYLWKLRDRPVPLGERTLLVGVLHVTGELEPDRAFARAVEMEEQGADLIDVSAASFRAGVRRPSPEDELARLERVLKRLRGKLAIPVSVATAHASVAGRAIELGAEVINDPTGLTMDPNMAKLAASCRCGLIVNHMRAMPEVWSKLGPSRDIIRMVLDDLKASLLRARRADVESEQIVLDPGLGFGKRPEENAEILARMQDLSELGRPILVGPSGKSLPGVGAGAGVPTSAATVTAAILAGAHLVRVHQVMEMVEAARTADSIAANYP